MAAEKFRDSCNHPATPDTTFDDVAGNVRDA